MTAIVAHDLAFYDHLPKLYPQADARSWFASLPPEQLERIAAQGSAMQGAYLMLAARSLGLDAGPIGGFDRAGIDETFLAGTSWKTNFLVNLGYADRVRFFPRNPRLEFDEAARII